MATKKTRQHRYSLCFYVNRKMVEERIRSFSTKREAVAWAKEQTASNIDPENTILFDLDAGCSVWEGDK